jgi:hypothetical protein
VNILRLSLMGGTAAALAVVGATPAAAALALFMASLDRLHVYE